jgi:SAM-dependent methyltransferase
MSIGNMKYVDAVKEYEIGLGKPLRNSPMAERCAFFLQAYSVIAGRQLSSEDRIVDFGCGSGAATKWLIERGYRAEGVDILEYWGRDSHLLGEIGPTLSDQVRARLHVVDPGKNELPFPDSSIVFLFSDQTLEHVFDYRPVFAEQARVLRPGGIAIHRFPHGLTIVEPHTNVPVAFLSKLQLYLAIWALLGRRNERQLGFNWRDTFISNRRLLATTHYASPREMRRAAAGLDLEVSFEDFLSISHGRAGRLYRSAASRGAGCIAKVILCRVQDNRFLVLAKPLKP